MTDLLVTALGTRRRLLVLLALTIDRQRPSELRDRPARAEVRLLLWRSMHLANGQVSHAFAKIYRSIGQTVANVQDVTTEVRYKRQNPQIGSNHEDVRPTIRSVAAPPPHTESLLDRRRGIYCS